MVQEKKPGTQRSTEIKRRNQHSKIRKNQWLKWLHVLSPLKWHLLCYFLSPIPDIPHFSVLVYVVSTDGTNKCEWHGRQATQLSQQRVYISMHEKDSDNHTKWWFFFSLIFNPLWNSFLSLLHYFPDNKRQRSCPKRKFCDLVSFVLYTSANF